MNQTHDSEHDVGAPPGSRHDEMRPAAGFWILMFASLVVVGGLAFAQFLRTPRVGAGRSGGTLATNLPEISAIPDMTLTDQHGKPVNLLRDLRGRVWVADFIFTSCAGPCPVMTQRMVELQKALIEAGQGDARCVSISVDPERDTPAKLREYAESWKPKDLSTWLLLTGERSQIRDLVTKHFLLALQEETADSPILHSSKFVLVDKRGRVRATYDVMTEEEEYENASDVLGRPMPADVREKIIQDVKSVMAESSP